MKKTLLASALGLSLAACSGSSTSQSTDAGSPAPTPPADPCAGVQGTCKGFIAGRATESDISAAFATATPGTTLAFGAGTFSFTNTLNLAAANITVLGAGLDQTVLDFSNQTGGSEGLYASDNSDGLLLHDFTVRDTKGDAIKVIGSSGVTFRKVKTHWTGADGTKHGAYGLYPVSCKKVLIEDSIVEGANDAGIYIGQSDQIIARNNRISFNVAGLEIENCFNADVHDNLAEGNTAGILVFDLPNLPQKGGHNVRVFNNTILSNNTSNFAAVGDIVGIVPAGTGFFVMANHDVEVFNNTVKGNRTAGLAAISYLTSGKPITDPEYVPFPSKVYMHDNTVEGNGTSPDPLTDIGVLLGTGSYPGGALPPVLLDGILPPGSTGANPTQLCFKNNGTGLVNLHLDQLNSDGTNLSLIETSDATPYDCTLPALPEVSF